MAEFSSLTNVEFIDPLEEEDDEEFQDIRSFRDPVFDIIQFDDFTCSFIDTPQFQRLRYLKQLGTSYFVYPGSSHNRFEHCLGTAHLARKLVLRLRERQPSLGITDRDVSCVTLAALTHDLGHGPFSHVFDNVFMPRLFAQHGKESTWCHEEASEMMFDALVRENEIDIELDRVNFIKDLIRGEPRLSKYHDPPEKPFLFDIVANRRNGMDVDKWDYIARDARAVGESCSHAASRLAEAARVIKDTIAYNWKDAHHVYELYGSRHSLHVKVYNHKTAKAIEHMVVEALLAADEVYNFAEAIHDPKKYLRLTDSILEEIERSDDPRLEKSRQIIYNLRRRRVPKMVEQKFLDWRFKKRWEDLLTPKAVVDMSIKLINDAKATDALLATIVVEDTEDEDMGRETRQDAVAAPTSLLPPAEINEPSRAQARPTPRFDEPLTEDDFIIDWTVLHFGMKEKDPIKLVAFWAKNSPGKITYSRPDQHGNLRPLHYQEAVLRCYSRDPSQSKKLQVQLAFRAVMKSLPDDLEDAAETVPSSQSVVGVGEPATPIAMECPRSNEGSFVMGSLSASPRVPGRRGTSSTPFATQPNGFTTVRPPGTTSKKRRRDGDQVADGSPQHKKRA